MIFSTEFLEAVIAVEVLPAPLDPLGVALSNRLAIHFGQAFSKIMIGRMHAATQTIPMRPDPRCSLEIRAP
eukprot:3254154-Pyramimonas_sp.AAC.1